ncbi:hypothetical protein HYR54_00510 [Candidatus Acetothermia bacterium]|nr:hypothetical protein [Candidatus Acetothermia bacterium]
MTLILPSGLQNLVNRLNQGEQVSLWDAGKVKLVRDTGGLHLNGLNHAWSLILEKPGAQRIKRASFELRWFARDKDRNLWPQVTNPGLEKIRKESRDLNVPGLLQFPDYWKNLLIDGEMFLAFINQLTRHPNIKRFRIYNAPDVYTFTFEGKPVPTETDALETDLSNVTEYFGPACALWAWPDPLRGGALHQIDADSPAPFTLNKPPMPRGAVVEEGRVRVHRYLGSFLSEAEAQDLWNNRKTNHVVSLTPDIIKNQDPSLPSQQVVVVYAGETVAMQTITFSATTPPPPDNLIIPPVPTVTPPVFVPLPKVTPPPPDPSGFSAGTRQLLIIKIFDAVRTGDRATVMNLLKALKVI